jgi:septum formation protein
VCCEFMAQRDPTAEPALHAKTNACNNRTMRKIILASGSPYRKELLEQAGYNVTAVASAVDEPDLALFPDLGAGLIYLALLKARAVERQGYSGLVLGADTVSLADGKILGKPADREAAAQMLRQLSGTTHDVLTGWCLLRTADGLVVSGVERTGITMRCWTDSELQSYLDSCEWQGKCGAYGLQLPIDPFVIKMSGSASNVIGLPLERLAAVWREFTSLSDAHRGE